MDQIIPFILTNAALGVGLSMDAFSISLANGLSDSKMKLPRMCLVSFIFAFFQFIMPFAGWYCVTTIAHIFTKFEKFIPYIALILLVFIGSKMIYEGIKSAKDDEVVVKTSLITLIVQGFATSVDALSVGFTIATYTLQEALLASGIIGVLTFAMCFVGVILGKTVGTKLSSKATIFGGGVLILIGLLIFFG